jgi:hypothetical protein
MSLETYQTAAAAYDESLAKKDRAESELRDAEKAAANDGVLPPPSSATPRRIAAIASHQAALSRAKAALQKAKVDLDAKGKARDLAWADTVAAS